MDRITIWTPCLPTPFFSVFPTSLSILCVCVSVFIQFLHFEFGTLWKTLYSSSSFVFISDTHLTIKQDAFKYKEHRDPNLNVLNYRQIDGIFSMSLISVKNNVPTTYVCFWSIPITLCFRHIIYI